MDFTFIESPVGNLLAARNERGLTSISFKGTPQEEWTRNDAAFADVREQLRAYFAKELRVFDLPLAPRGTAFQLDVWHQLREIPYGETRSYADIARRIGSPTASRAVARACATNPAALVIPCHRVVKESGDLGGYRWGVDRKRALLEREKDA